MRRPEEGEGSTKAPRRAALTPDSKQEFALGPKALHLVTPRLEIRKSGVGESL